MDQTKMLERSHMLQSWRPDDMTLALDQELSEPFCMTCADWHTADEDHSMINRAGVFESFVPLECMLCPAEGWSEDGTLPGWTLTKDMGGEDSDLCPSCTAEIQ